MPEKNYFVDPPRSNIEKKNLLGPHWEEFYEFYPSMDVTIKYLGHTVSPIDCSISRWNTQKAWTLTLSLFEKCFNLTYRWWKKSCISWGWQFIPLFARFYTSQVVIAAFLNHQQYHPPLQGFHALQTLQISRSSYTRPSSTGAEVLILFLYRIYTSALRVSFTPTSSKSNVFV